MPLSSRLKMNGGLALTLTDRQKSALSRILSRLEDGTYTLEKAPCYCGADADIVIAEQDRYGLPAPALLCMNCGLLRTSPRLDKKSAARFHTDDYRELYSGLQNGEQRLEKDIEYGRVLLESLPSLLSSVDTVFDVGCGTGGALLPLKEAGKTVAGCDDNEEFLELGRKNGLDLVKGGVKDLALHTGRNADVILLSNVLEHSRDPRQGLLEIIEAVRPGGIILAESPGIFAIPSQYGGNLLLFLQNAHNYYYCEATLRSLFESVGLEIVEADERIFLGARRPQSWSPESAGKKIAAAEPTALEVLSFLASLEKELLQSAAEGLENAQKKIAAAEKTVEPWPLHTEAMLRVIAWPDYASVDALEKVLRVAEPLYGRKEFCLCLRHDPDVDIPMDEAGANLQKAFERLDQAIDLNVLFIDDAMSREDWPRLGKSVTAALHIIPIPGDIRTEFINALGVEVITGDPA